VENTLYRRSKYSLTQASNFFASAFSIEGIADPREGGSDEYPIILPLTVTCADFNIFLWFQTK